MVKEFKKAGVSIQIDEDGKVTYAAGNMKTTFHLSDCDGRCPLPCPHSCREPPFDASTSNKSLDTIPWQLILKGEDLLERNNQHTETRRHISYDDKNDKWPVFKDMEVNIEEQIIQQENAEELKAAIDSLLPQQKELIQLIYFQQLTITEIARMNGVDKSAISHRLKKALKRLRKILGKV